MKRIKTTYTIISDLSPGKRCYYADTYRKALQKCLALKNDAEKDETVYGTIEIYKIVHRREVTSIIPMKDFIIGNIVLDTEMLEWFSKLMGGSNNGAV